jgi:hypothetical protein
LKADAGVVPGSSGLLQWSDQSGNGRHATQPNSSSQPGLRPLAINGLSAVRFDGQDDFLSFTLPVNGLEGLSLFLVAANTRDQGGGPTQAEEAALFWNETAPWGTVYLTPLQSVVYARFGTTETGNRLRYQRPAAVGASFTVTTAIKDGPTDMIFVNGALVLSQPGRAAAIAGCRDTADLGRGLDDNTFFAGDIAEALVYTRALSAVERVRVEQYLGTRYGLPVELAGGGGGLVRVELRLEHLDGTLRISWPGAGTEYVLQQSERLGDHEPWSDVAAGLSVQDDRSSVTLPPGRGQRFFRLRRR